jgi:hypothetical protein
MNLYKVTFSYSVLVEAKDVEEAESEGVEEFDNRNVNTYEMNIEIEKEKAIKG